jgi:hypothetical protein
VELTSRLRQLDKNVDIAGAVRALPEVAKSTKYTGNDEDMCAFDIRLFQTKWPQQATMIGSLKMRHHPLHASRHESMLLRASGRASKIIEAKLFSNRLRNRSLDSVKGIWTVCSRSWFLVASELNCMANQWDNIFPRQIPFLSYNIVSSKHCAIGLHHPSAYSCALCCKTGSRMRRNTTDLHSLNKSIKLASQIQYAVATLLSRGAPYSLQLLPNSLQGCL